MKKVIAGQFSRSIEELLVTLTPEQRDAYDYLDEIRIDWDGKPIADRDEANTRHGFLTNSNQDA